jgi:hypothetical protein
MSSVSEFFISKEVSIYNIYMSLDDARKVLVKVVSFLILLGLDDKKKALS